MADERRQHLNDYRHRYRTFAAAGAWDSAKLAAILLRRQSYTDEAVAEALYAEGYAREKLNDTRLAAACYALAVRLTGHPKAARRLDGLTSTVRG